MSRLRTLFFSCLAALAAACASPPEPVRPTAPAPPPPAAVPAPAPAPSPHAEDHGGPSAEGGEWRDVEYSDLIVPGGFAFQEEQSYTFMQEGARMADLSYVGEMAPADTAAFFLKGLPAAGWKLKRFSGLATKTLAFHKGDEEALVSVTPGRGSTLLRIMVHARTPR